MDKLKKSTASKLTALREKNNISKSTLAEALEVSINTIESYEQGERVPRNEMKVKISKYFNVSVLDLFYKN